MDDKKYYGKSPIEDMIPLQREVNMARSKKMDELYSLLAMGGMAQSEEGFEYNRWANEQQFLYALRQFTDTLTMPLWKFVLQKFRKQHV